MSKITYTFFTYYFLLTTFLYLLLFFTYYLPREYPLTPFYPGTTQFPLSSDLLGNYRCFASYTKLTLQHQLL